MTQLLHVLLVDRRPLGPESLEHRLKRTGYRTTLVQTREHALETARRDAPDLIVVAAHDANDTDLDSQRTCRELKQLRPELPVILYGDAANTNASACGADEFIGKPADPALVMQKIVQLLGR
ncbi:MAG: Response regulator receiver domain [Pseudomonadota bacterium]